MAQTKNVPKILNRVANYPGFLNGAPIPQSSELWFNQAGAIKMLTFPHYKYYN
jgi:hypothetical protein